MKARHFFLLFTALTSLLSAQIFIVTSLQDSGSGTLREAMTLATDADGIEFDGALSGTLSLSSTLPTPTASRLTIKGPSNRNISIDANGSCGIFEIEDTLLLLYNLNLLRGVNPSKGGIVRIGEAGRCYMQNVSVTPANTGNGANPLFVDTYGVLDVVDVSFTSQNASQIYLHAGYLSITGSSDTTYIVDGDADGHINKYGSGLARILSPSLATAHYYLTVANDTLLFEGATTDPVNVMPTGIFQGNCSVSDMINTGSMQPGTSSSLGTISVSGDCYTVNGAAAIKLTPVGDSDLIETDHTAYIINSALTFLPESGTYLQGTKFTFMTADDGVKGEFSAVDFGGLDAQVNYLSNSVELEILHTTIL